MIIIKVFARAVYIFKIIFLERERERERERAFISYSTTEHLNGKIELN